MRSDDQDFRKFAEALEQEIARRGVTDLTGAQKLSRQRGQFERLAKCEDMFRRKILKHHPWAYEQFIAEICDENGNILTARPYFRERQNVCIGPITQALQRRDRQALSRYHFNYHFVEFVKRLRPWRRDGLIPALYKEIVQIRQAMIVENMPLAISQARMFWAKAPAKTQDTRFAFLDFVQVAADGLASAIDKFVLPPAAAMDADPEVISVWRSVAIGRMTGNFIEMFNETPIHFYPKYKRILYRANKHLKEHQSGIDIVRLTQQVNDDIGIASAQTNPEELASLMAAASMVQSDAKKVCDGDDASSVGSVIDRTEADREQQPDNMVESSEAGSVMKTAIDQLCIFESKVLACRGVRI